MKNLTTKELVKLATKKAGRDRMNAITELCLRTGTVTLKGALLALDLTEPKIK